MAELEKERVKLAKRDRKEANGLLDAVEAQDVPRVTHLLAIGVNPDARIDQAHPCSVKGWRMVTAHCRLRSLRGTFPSRGFFSKRERARSSWV